MSFTDVASNHTTPLTLLKCTSLTLNNSPSENTPLITSRILSNNPSSANTVMTRLYPAYEESYLRKES
jgi:hypothetical protein